jgi:hypothetical protein
MELITTIGEKYPGIVTVSSEAAENFAAWKSKFALAA